MTTLDDIAIQLDHIERRQDAKEEVLRRIEEAVTRMRRDVDHTRALLAALIVVVTLATAMVWWAFDTRDEARRNGRAATCEGFNAYTDALIASSVRSQPNDVAELKARVQQFAADLEERLAPLGCDIHPALLNESPAGK